MAQFYIGTSGFAYKHWKKIFYPEKLPQREWLTYYCKFFNTLELNVTFYALPQEKTFHTWYDNTPKNFVFAIKGPRLITHYKKLKNIENSLAAFFDRVKILEEKVKVILWQFPSNFEYDSDKIDYFLILLEKFKYSYAFEFRSKSWLNAEVYRKLSALDAVVVECDWPFLITKTKPKNSSFSYIRRHGATALYASLYSKRQLKSDAQKIEKNFNNERDTYIYFNNDALGHAVKNALELKDLSNKLKKR